MPEINELLIVIDNQKTRISGLKTEVSFWKNEAKKISDEYATYRNNLKVIVDKFDLNKIYSIVEGVKNGD